jgi:hypothetical protein
VAGHVFDTTGSYTLAFGLFAVTNLLALGLLLGIRRETGAT